MIFKKSSNSSNSVNINARDMKHPPFESSRWDDSNDTKTIEIWSLDVKIDQNIFKSSSSSNSVNINARDIKHTPFESSRWDDSNDTKIIEIQSLDAEINTKTYFYFMLHKIIIYSVNEVAYNEVLICWNLRFVIERGTVYCNKISD